MQLACTAVLVFCMGIVLGRREDLWRELGTLGWDSFLLAAVPMGLSALLVYALTRRLKGGRPEASSPEAGESRAREEETSWR